MPHPRVPVRFGAGIGDQMLSSYRTSLPVVILRADDEVEHAEPRRRLAMPDADPPLPRHRRPPRAAARARRPATSRCRRISPQLAEHLSAREREAADIEYAADDICLAWLLEGSSSSAAGRTGWDGEISGVIGSGLFVRFGEVFEGYLPARRLTGDYFELNPLGRRLVGRRGERAYRLGDPIERPRRGDPPCRGESRAVTGGEARRLSWPRRGRVRRRYPSAGRGQPRARSVDCLLETPSQSR